MNIIIKGASGFMGLFDTGAETFVSLGVRNRTKGIITVNLNEYDHRPDWTGKS